MSRRGRVSIILLIEDERHQRFLYRYLQKRGFSRDEIRPKIAPGGGGSAEQWVRERYAKEVKECRTRAAQTLLVVMLDADISTVAKRQHQLDRSLDEERLHRRSSKEPIAHLIPKRNIETWILCLNNKQFKGHPINEQEDYKPHSKTLKVDEQIKPAAEEFFNWSRPNADVPERCVDSIRLAILEVRKIE